MSTHRWEDTNARVNIKPVSTFTLPFRINPGVKIQRILNNASFLDGGRNEGPPTALGPRTVFQCEECGLCADDLGRNAGALQHSCDDVKDMVLVQEIMDR